MNPIRQARQQRGLSQLQLAMLLGMDYHTIVKAELGYYSHIPAALLAGLKDQGFDGETLQKQYQEWRAKQAQQLTTPPVAE